MKPRLTFGTALTLAFTGGAAIAQSPILDVVADKETGAARPASCNGCFRV